MGFTWTLSTTVCPASSGGLRNYSVLSLASNCGEEGGGSNKTHWLNISLGFNDILNNPIQMFLYIKNKIVSNVNSSAIVPENKWILVWWINLYVCVKRVYTSRWTPMLCFLLLRLMQQQCREAACLWHTGTGASLGEAHMYFRGVSLIQHEIQFETWSASRSPALIQRQIAGGKRGPGLRDQCLLLCVSRQINTGIQSKQTH